MQYPNSGYEEFNSTDTVITRMNKGICIVVNGNTEHHSTSHINRIFFDQIGSEKNDCYHNYLEFDFVSGEKFKLILDCNGSDIATTNYILSVENILKYQNKDMISPDEIGFGFSETFIRLVIAVKYFLYGLLVFFFAVQFFIDVSAITMTLGIASLLVMIRITGKRNTFATRNRNISAAEYFRVSGIKYTA